MRQSPISSPSWLQEVVRTSVAGVSNPRKTRSYLLCGGSHHSPLRGARLTPYDLSFFQYAHVQPHPDPSQDRTVVDAPLQNRSQVCRLNRVEELGNVGINNPIDAQLQTLVPKIAQCPVRAMLPPESIRERMKVRFIHRFQQHDHGSLHNLI